MTLKEMQERINDWCANYSSPTMGKPCDGCPLHELPGDWCYEYENKENGEQLLKDHYEILFGEEETEEKNMEETKTELTAEQKIEILRQMSADAFEWATGMEPCDGYWRGVAYMMSSVLEMGNETD